MIHSNSTCNVFAKIEALMLYKFETEPFHNLRLMIGPEKGACLPGGSCSDKTLSFLEASNRAGFPASLHTAFIDGREIHRLARYTINGRIYFADVGNGWPALRLYPTDREVCYDIYGTRFRTTLSDAGITVHHRRGDKEFKQMDILFKSRSEVEIQAEIDSRFDVDFEYPFSLSLRFALVVGNQFFFLRGDKLEIYSDSGFKRLEYTGSHQLPKVARAMLHTLPVDLQKIFET